MKDTYMGIELSHKGYKLIKKIERTHTRETTEEREMSSTVPC